MRRQLPDGSTLEDAVVSQAVEGLVPATVPAGHVRPSDTLQLAKPPKFGSPVEIVGIGSSVITAFFVALFASIAAFLCFASYARKEAVQGIITPVDGAVAVTALQSGIISSLPVKEDQWVKRGDTIAVIDPTSMFETGENLSGLLAISTGAERAALGQRDAANAELYEVGKSELRARRTRIASAYASLDDMDALYAERIALARRDVETFENLFKLGAESELRLRNVRAVLLELEITQGQLVSKRIELDNEIALIAVQQRQIEAERDRTHSESGEAGARLLEKEATIKGRGPIIVTADIDGRISALQTRIGSFAPSGATIATILPAGASLEARLWLPSRSIGFVDEGDPVKLMYDAFPFEHFGLARGSIKRVSRAPVDVRDLPPELKSPEPLYLVVASLERQTMRADNQEWSLKAGMRLSADIILERRTLLSWLLDPFNSIQKRHFGGPGDL
jgi:membrane fusion protein